MTRSPRHLSSYHIIISKLVPLLITQVTGRHILSESCIILAGGNLMFVFNVYTAHDHNWGVSSVKTGVTPVRPNN